MLKVAVKTFIMSQKISGSRKRCSFQLSVYDKSQFQQKYEATQLFSTLIIIRNVS